ncbi:MAG: hypothetical protein WD294_12250 [Phycisphaeraceae bacterium]
MIRSIFGLCALVLALSLAAGCNDQEPTQPTPEAPEVDYDAEARETIDEENLDEELDALERQLSADEQELSNLE